MPIVKKGQKVILIHAVERASPSKWQEISEEMKGLSQAAGLQVLSQLKQNLRSIDPAFLVGEGKRKEIEAQVRESKPHYVIFNHKLSGVQTRNWGKLLKIPVWDRSQLILEIFAQRAYSHEGKLQVNLAQLWDQMSRMPGAWLGSLSRQGGRGRARGPGEKALEKDRRQIQLQIQRIQKKLEKVKKRRSGLRQSRKKRQIPALSLIGWTNSGKSALLNRLTQSKVQVKDQLFMTLDTKTRRLFLPGAPPAVITDTVGFIRDLPPHLLSAFQATLEESAGAHILLHVVDTSHPEKNQRREAINDLIKKFHWEKKPMIYVFNKADLLDISQEKPPQKSNSILVSAKTGWNIPSLRLKIKSAIEDLKQKGFSAGL